MLVVLREPTLQVGVDLVLVVVQREEAGDAESLGRFLGSVGIGNGPHHADEAFALGVEDGVDMTSRSLDRGDEFDAAVPRHQDPHAERARLLVIGRVKGAAEQLLVERPPGLEITNRHHDSVHTLLFHRSTPPSDMTSRCQIGA